MKFVTRAAVAAVCAALALAPSAMAAGSADCVQLGKKVNEALTTAQPGRNTSDARSEARVGATYCSAQMYAQGAARYNHALELLAKS
jgi:hypothetical protein